MKQALGGLLSFSKDDYRVQLSSFDGAVCEATAVGQAVAGRLASPAIGYSTHVYTRICAHAQSMICAVPKSRWVKRDFEIWDVSSVASHARSILEGYLLFRYLADAPNDEDIQRTYVNVMHLYDCKKRMKILPFVLPEEEIIGFQKQAVEIEGRLNSSPFFQKLDQRLKKDLLAGRWMMITSQSELVSQLGFDKEEFDFFWNYLSQYTHILSFTFYRIESEGRGSGLKNDFDRETLCLVLQFCTSLLKQSVDRLIELFPDSAEARQGVDSKFSPGPIKNLPKHRKRTNRH